MGSTRVWVAMRANSLRRFAANRCIQAKCVLGPSLGHRRSVPRLSTRRPASCSRFGDDQGDNLGGEHGRTAEQDTLGAFGGQSLTGADADEAALVLRGAGMMFAVISPDALEVSPGSSTKTATVPTWPGQVTPRSPGPSGSPGRVCWQAGCLPLPVECVQRLGQGRTVHRGTGQTCVGIRALTRCQCHRS